MKRHKVAVAEMVGEEEEMMVKGEPAAAFIYNPPTRSRDLWPPAYVRTENGKYDMRPARFVKAHHIPGFPIIENGLETMLHCIIGCTACGSRYCMTLCRRRVMKSQADSGCSGGVSDDAGPRKTIRTRWNVYLLLFYFETRIHISPNNSIRTASESVHLSFLLLLLIKLRFLVLSTKPSPIR